MYVKYATIQSKIFIYFIAVVIVPLIAPNIYTKNLDSLVVKAYRKNVLNNGNFPNPPNEGWITPENWLETVKDIIRTTITVKYREFN